MKNLVLMISVVLCAAACDSQSTSTPQAKTTPVIDVPTEKETKEEIKENVKDVLKERPPKWKVEYTGDYKGEIHGGIMSVVSVSTTTSVAGGAMTADRKAKATQSFRTTIFNPNKTVDGETNAQTSIVLPDGTRCVNNSQSAKKQSVAKVHNSTRKEFHATLTGELFCGDKKDKKITYSALLKKKP